MAGVQLVTIFRPPCSHSSQLFFREQTYGESHSSMRCSKFDRGQNTTEPVAPRRNTDHLVTKIHPDPWKNNLLTLPQRGQLRFHCSALLRLTWASAYIGDSIAGQEKSHTSTWAPCHLLSLAPLTPTKSLTPSLDKEIEDFQPAPYVTAFLVPKGTTEIGE